MIDVAANLEHVKTNPDYCVDEIRISYRGVRVRVGRNTGNWHPDGKPWLASVGADRHYYDDPEQYSFGLADWGTSRTEAIMNAWKFAKSKTLRFPKGWLQEIMLAIEAASLHNAQ